MSKVANWDAATALCTPQQYGSDQWRAHYEANPDILTKMLGDLYRVYKSEQAKRAGTANPSGGRRKAHINGNLEELWSIITPRFSVDPFHVAFQELRGGQSLRQFADKLGWNSMKLSRMVKGSQGTLKGYYVMNRYDLEEIARVGGVHPAYFVEWRLLLVQDLLAEVCKSQPNLSISMLRALTQ